MPKYLKYFPNINEVISNVGLKFYGFELGDYEILNPNDHVNKCQFSNDAYLTGFRVSLYYYNNQLVDYKQYLTDQLDKKAIEFIKVIKMGQTQLQGAVPISLGGEFDA